MNPENSETKKTNFSWPPLEGDPQIFTKYAQKVGLLDNYYFEELLSLDYKDMGMFIETPVKSVIVNSERVKGKGRYSVKENMRKWDFVPFYMKQKGSLDNACGLVAMLQSFGNIIDTLPYKSNSILSKFYESTKDLDDIKRCEFLENYKEFQNEHTSYSNEGQSNLCENQEEVRTHFVAYIFYKGNLVELDGCLDGPQLIKENIKEEDLVDETIAEIRKRLDAGLITETLSIMYLTKAS